MCKPVLDVLHLHHKQPLQAGDVSSTVADYLQAHQHCHSHHGGEKVGLKAHPAQVGGHLQRSKLPELCAASADAEIWVHTAPRGCTKIKVPTVKFRPGIP